MYRDEVQALEARHAALEAEVAERVRERDEVASMLAEARGRDEEARRLADLAAGGPARRRMRRIQITVVSALGVLFGGMGVYRSTRPDRHMEALDQLSVFVDRMCSCRDSECTRRVSDELGRWASEMPRDHSAAELKEVHKRRASALTSRMSECMSRNAGPAAYQ